IMKSSITYPTISSPGRYRVHASFLRKLSIRVDAAPCRRGLQGAGAGLFEAKEGSSTPPGPKTKTAAVSETRSAVSFAARIPAGSSRALIQSYLCDWVSLLATMGCPGQVFRALIAVVDSSFDGGAFLIIVPGFDQQVRRRIS